MVPWIDPDTLPLAVGPYDAAAVSVSVDPEPFQPRSVPLSAIDAAWQQARTAAVAAEAELFDGPLLRVRHVVAGRNSLEIRAQPTSFRFFVGTNLVDPSLPAADRADPLGISAVIVTSDDRLILGRRGQRVHRHKGRIHCIGGHVEPPGDLGVEPARVDTAAAMTSELIEEVTLAAEDLLSIGSLGVVRENESRQPEQLFVVKVGRAAATLLPRGSEHAALVSLDATPTGIDHFLAESRDETVPVARAALHLFRSLEAADWPFKDQGG